MSAHEDYLIESVKKNAEKIGNTDIFMSIVTKDYLDDPYCAMQLGLAILMDKPIRLLVKQGCPIPSSLKMIAERIVFYGPLDDVKSAALELLKG